MAIDERVRGRGWPGGVRLAGVTLMLACGLLFGCASTRAAGDSFVGWLHSDDEPPAAQTAPPSGKTATTAVKKKPAAAAAATPKSVEPEAPVAAEPSDPEPESQAPEQSIFDPY